MKQKLAYLLALLMVLVLTVSACSTADNTGSESSSSSSGSSDTAQTAAGDSDSVGEDSSAKKDPINFTFYSEDGSKDQPWTTPVAQLIEELTGVSLTFSYPVGGADVQIPLMAASGDYPDLIFGKGTGSAQLLEAEAVVNLAPYFEKSKHVKDFYGELLPRLYYNGDPNTIWSYGSYAIKQQIWNCYSSLPIQNAVLKEFGYPEIRTVYEAEELCRQYIAKYPEGIDGKPFYMLSLNNSEGWRYIIDLGNPSGFLAGYPDNGEWLIDETTLEATIKYLSPEIKTYYQWLNKLWNDDLIDPDSFTQTNEDWEAKIANGQVLAAVSADWMYREPEQAKRLLGLEDRTFAQLPMTWSEDIKPNGSYDPGWSGGWGVMITKNCKDPQRAFDFIDWMCSEEGLTARYWGVEGVHYDVVDGIRVLKPEVQEKLASDPDYGNAQGFDWVYPFPEMGDGWTDSTGSTITRNTKESIIKDYTQAAKDTLAAYGVAMWADLYPATSSFTLSPFGAAWQVDIPTDSRINELIQWVQNTWLPQEMAKCVTTSVDNFETQWAESQQKLIDGGVNELNEMFTELVKAKAKAWGN